MESWLFIVLIGYPLFAIFILLLKYFLHQSKQTKYVVLMPILFSSILGFGFLMYAILSLAF